MLCAAGASGQKADLEKSEVVNATRENMGKIFRVKVRLKDVGNVPDTPTTKNWEETVIRCFVNKDNFVQASVADKTNLEFNCNFDYAKVRDLGTLPIKLTFNSKIEDIATVKTLYATPVKNDLNVKTTIGDPVWNQGESFVTIPISVDQSISVTMSLDCSTPDIPTGNFGKEVVTLTKGVSNSVKVNLKPNFAQGMSCKVSVSEGDSLTDIADFKFLSSDSKTLEPKAWSATISDQYRISIPSTEALKDKIILVNSFAPMPITITTTKLGNLQMLVDNKSEGAESVNQINHNFTISKNKIVELAAQKLPHTVTFRSGQMINETFPLIIDIDTKLASSRINFKDKKLLIEYTLSRPVQTYLKFPDLTDFQEVKGVKCDDNGRCEKLFTAETTQFIDAVAKSLKGEEKQKTLNIQIVSSANEELISTLQFDVVKVGLDEKKFAELQQKIINDKNFETNKETYRKDVATNIFACGTGCNPEESQAIEYLLERLRKDKGQNKFTGILKFGAKIALSYFGIPIPI